MHDAWRELADVPNRFGPAVVTIGNFDGVHLGHQQVLRRAAAAAHAGGLQSVALTFEPHPLTIVAPDRAPQRLTSLAHKADLIRSLGIGAVVCMRFTEAVARLSPREFAERVLAGRLSAKRVLVGENFRFGRRQAGNTDTLRSLGRDLGFAVECGGTLSVHGEPVSSTRVRGLLREGLVAQARRLLGRVFCLRGEVVRGRGIGSRRTVPTLNLSPDSDVLPADGVYVTCTRLDDDPRWRESITNVGTRPTFQGRSRTVETHLLQPLRGDPPDALELGFASRVRDERSFPSAELLKEQIRTDIGAAERFFRRLRAASAAAGGRGGGAAGADRAPSGSHNGAR